MTIQNDCITIYKDLLNLECQSITIPYIFHVIIPWQNKFIIKDSHKYYIINYNIVGLIEKTFVYDYTKYSFNYFHFIINNHLIATDGRQLYHASMDNLNFKSLYTYQEHFYVYDMCVKNQYIVIILQHESDIFNEYFYWFNNTDKLTNDALMIIYNYNTKNVIYQQELKYTPHKVSMIGSTILLEWEDNSQLLAYNIKYLL
jgi:hypothetical protein